jgi:[acyl-carrier-protein] S-malonyltransferase
MGRSVTLLFPGQGSQYVGMGKNLETHPTAFEYFHRANEALGFKLSEFCFEGPESSLKMTENTQPAILTHSIALFERLQILLKETGSKIDCVLGHSVGEYAALVAAGTLSFEDAVKIVNKRGRFMQSAVPAGVGKMFAILKLSEDIVAKACAEVSTSDSSVQPANFNGPDQVVISGEASACERALAWLNDNTEEKFRAIELQVSAPFHCDLMKPAEENLAKELTKIKINSNAISYIANVDATLYPSTTEGDIIRQNLVKQVCGSVLWSQSIRQIPAGSLCLEVGPGKVLAGLVKKIHPDLAVISLDSEAAWTELQSILKAPETDTSSEANA